jgi:hypothetical protein
MNNGKKSKLGLLLVALVPLLLSFRCVRSAPNAKNLEDGCCPGTVEMD